MAVYFLDSSALAKRFIIETGTSWTISLFKPANANRIYVARITLVEVVSALTRRFRLDSINQSEADKTISRFNRIFRAKLRQVEITEALAENAADLVRKHFLRGYDAVQLAAAIEANEARISLGAGAITFVSADRDLNISAIAEGLLVANPNDHQ